MKRYIINYTHIMFFLLSAGSIAYLGTQSLQFLPVLTLYFLLLSLNRDRLFTFLIALAYYCVGSRGLVSGGAAYFGSLSSAGLVAWIAGNAILATTTALCTSQNKRIFIALQALLLTLLFFPPIGLISWMNPLVNAGIFLPGLGTIGYIGFGVIVLVLMALPRSMRITGFVCLSVTGFIVITPNNLPAPTRGFTSIDTEYGDIYRGMTDPVRHIKTQANFIRSALNAPKSEYLMLPESAMGLVNDATQGRWGVLSNTLNTVIVIGGSSSAQNNSNKLVNKLYYYVPGSSAPLAYIQRVPIPFGMWNPFSSDNAGYDLALDNEPVVSIRDLHFANLLCYEASLLYLTLPFDNATDLNVSGNMFWAPDSLLRAQLIWSQATARLYGLRLNISRNLAPPRLQK